MPSVQLSVFENYQINDVSLALTTSLILSYLGFIITLYLQPKHLVLFICFSTISTIIISLHFFLYPLLESICKCINQVGEKISKTKVRGYYNPSKEENYFVFDQSPHKLSTEKGWGAIPETPWELDQT